MNNKKYREDKDSLGKDVIRERMIYSFDNVSRKDYSLMIFTTNEGVACFLQSARTHVSKAHSLQLLILARRLEY